MCSDKFEFGYPVCVCFCCASPRCCSEVCIRRSPPSFLHFGRPPFSITVTAKENWSVLLHSLSATCTGVPLRSHSFSTVNVRSGTRSSRLLLGFPLRPFVVSPEVVPVACQVCDDMASSASEAAGESRGARLAQRRGWILVVRTKRGTQPNQFHSSWHALWQGKPQAWPITSTPEVPAHWPISTAGTRSAANSFNAVTSVPGGFHPRQRAVQAALHSGGAGRHALRGPSYVAVVF